MLARGRRLDKRKIMIVTILAFAMVLSFVAATEATTSTNSNYYRLYCPRQDVSIFTDVTITAKSNDWRVDTVTFYWFSPEGKEFQQTVNVVQVGNEKVATCTFKVDVIGTWTVKPLFIGRE